MMSGGWDPRLSDSTHVRAQVDRVRERAQLHGARSLPTILLLPLLAVLIPFWTVRALWRLYRRLRPRTPTSGTPA